MRKLIIEFLIIVVVLVSVKFILSKIDWMTIFNVEKRTQKTEEKIGDLFWNLLKKSETEITADSILSPIDSMITRICTKNGIARAGIKIHLLWKSEVNAFALPNNHLIVYSDLINACENESELCGVLSHELAHIEKNHIMNKLVKDVGLSVLISMTTGNGNSEVIRETIKHLSSTAYDRSLESEADKTATEYLIKANIDPEPFANFLYRLAAKDGLPDNLNWLNTHPDSKERAEKIIATIKNKELKKIPVISNQGWIQLKKLIAAQQ